MSRQGWKEWGLAFTIKVNDCQGLNELLEVINESLGTRINMQGGTYGENFVQVTEHDFYDSSIPSDFDSNYQFEIDVTLSNSTDVTEDQVIMQTKIADRFSKILTAAKCPHKFIFSFALPDGADPETLFD